MALATVGKVRSQASKVLPVQTVQVPDYEDRLSKFERMCVVKTFREDRTLVAAADYISDALGQRFVESVPLNMERAWAESHKKCPLICLLSPGECSRPTCYMPLAGLVYTATTHALAAPALHQLQGS